MTTYLDNETDSDSDSDEPLALNQIAATLCKEKLTR